MTTTLFGSATGDASPVSAAAVWQTPRKLEIVAIAMSAFSTDTLSDGAIANWQFSGMSIYTEADTYPLVQDSVLASCWSGPSSFITPPSPGNFFSSGVGFFFIPMSEKFRRGVQLYLHGNAYCQTSVCHATIHWKPTH